VNLPGGFAITRPFGGSKNRADSIEGVGIQPDVSMPDVF
jgi:hypothetical protein